ncbi:MAG: flagellar basal body-associated FliL family protein [Pseudomonadota bacterium]
MVEPNDKITDPPESNAPAPRRSPLRFLVPVIAFLVPAGGAFYAAYSGIVPLPIGEAGHADKSAKVRNPLAPVTFVPIDEMIITLGPDARARHLILEAEIETIPEAAAMIEKLRPRIEDLFNTYLRAVEERDLEDPGGMTKLRAQLLRRIRIVVGSTEIRDLLFTKFVMK